MTLITPHKLDSQWWQKQYSSTSTNDGNTLMGGSNAGYLTSNPSQDLARAMSTLEQTKNIKGSGTKRSVSFALDTARRQHQFKKQSKKQVKKKAKIQRKSSKKQSKKRAKRQRKPSKKQSKKQYKVKRQAKTSVKRQVKTSVKRQSKKRQRIGPPPKEAVIFSRKHARLCFLNWIYFR